MPDWATYIIFQEEVGDSGYEHYQGYVECCNPQSMLGIKKKLQCPYAHVEPRRGTALQAAEYCAKPGGIQPLVEFGRISSPGTRTDLEWIKEQVKLGTPMQVIAEAQVGDYLRYHRGIEKLVDLLGPKKNRSQVEIVIFYGVPRGGKTQQALRMAPNAYIKDPTTFWWDGYVGQDTVIVNDFDPDHHAWTWHQMFSWLDPKPALAQYKGGYLTLTFSRIIFTSNFAPITWFSSERTVTQQSFFARVNECGWMKEFTHPFIKSDPDPTDMIVIDD